MSSRFYHIPIFLYAKAFLCLFGMSQNHAQNSFSTLLPVDEPGGIARGVAVAETDSAYHIVSIKTYKSNGFDTTHNIVQKISKSGIFESDWSLGVDSSYLHGSYWYNVADFDTDQKWLGAAYRTLPNGDYYRNLYQFSENFDSIQKTIPFTVADPLSIYGVKYIEEDGSLLVGHGGFSTTYGFSVKISKLDTLGNNLWTTDIKPPSLHIMYFPHINHNMKYYDICKTEDDGYFVSMFFSQDNGSNNFYLITKLDAGGTITWNKLVRDEYRQSAPGKIIYQDTNSYLVTWAQHGLLNHENSTIGTNAGKDSVSIWMGEMDLEGNFKWQKQFYNVANNCDTVVWSDLYIPYDILKTQDGNYLLCVDFLRNGAVYLKVSPLGEVIWNRWVTILEDANADAQEAFLNVKFTTETQDGGFIGVGEYVTTASSMFPNATVRSAVIKMDQYGCVEPGCHLEGCTDPSATNYNPDAVYDCGCQYDPCPGQHTITIKARHFRNMNAIDYDVKVVNSSTPILEYVAPPTHNEQISVLSGCFAADCYHPLELYIDYHKVVPPNALVPFASSDSSKTGYFAYFKVFIDDSLILDIGDQIFRKRDTTIYIYHCNYDTTTPLQVAYSMYPNPVKDNFTFTIPTADFSSENTYVLSIYDKVGRMVLTQQINATQTTLPLGNISLGAYTAILRKNEEVVFTEKIIKSE